MARPDEVEFSILWPTRVYTRTLPVMVLEPTEAGNEPEELLLGLLPFFQWFDVDFHLRDDEWFLTERTASPAVQPNPTTAQEVAVEKAAKEVEVFTAREARSVKMLSLKPFKVARRKLCRFEDLIYNSPKWTGRRRRFWHPWADGLSRHVWLTENGYIIAAGPARNTAAGIDDFKGVFRLQSHANSLESVVKSAKGWAKLADLEMVSLPCKKCGTTLRYDGDGNPQRWVCKRCGGETPKYRISGGEVYYDPDKRFLIAIGKVSG